MHKYCRVFNIEEGHNTLQAELSGLKTTLSWAAIDKIVVCKKIPVDRCHNSKIDYPALYKMLERLQRSRSGMKIYNPSQKHV